MAVQKKTKTFPSATFGLWVLLVCIGFMNPMTAATLTWTDGSSGNLLDAGAWQGSTYSQGDDLQVRDGGYVNLGTGNILDLGATKIWLGRDLGQSASANLLGGNLSLKEFSIGGYNGDGYFSARQANITLTEHFQVGYNASATGNVDFIDVHFDSTTPYKNIVVGRTGSGNMSVYSSNLIGLQAFRLAQSDDSYGEAWIDQSLITAHGINIGWGAGSALAMANVTNSTLSSLSLDSGSLHVGRSGTANLYLDNTHVQNFDSIIIGSEVGSSGCLLASQSNIQVKNLNAGNYGHGEAYLKSSRLNLSSQLMVGNYSGSSGNLELQDVSGNIRKLQVAYNADTLATAILNNTHLNCTSPALDSMNVGHKGQGNLTLNNSSLLHFKQFNMGYNEGASGNVLLSSSNIIAQDIQVGYKGYGRFTANSSNITVNNLLSIGASTNGIGYLEMNDTQATFSQQIYGGGGSGDTAQANIVLNRVNFHNISTGKYLSIGHNSSCVGTINSSNISGFGHLYVGFSPTVTGNASLINTNIDVTNNIAIGRSSGYVPSYLRIQGGNVNCANFRVSDNAICSLMGGSANITTSTITLQKGAIEHYIGKEKSSGEHIGHLQTSSQTKAAGNVHIGVMGGAAFVSKNTFHIQKGATNVGSLAGFARLPTGYDLSLVNDVGDGTSRKGILAQVAAGNVETALNLNNRWVHNTHSSFGMVEVQACDPQKQYRGLVALLKLSSGTATDVIQRLTAAGYSCQTVNGSNYDLQLSIDVSDLPTGSGYFIWDFRDLHSEIPLAVIEKLSVIPTPSGQIFGIR